MTQGNSQKITKKKYNNKRLKEEEEKKKEERRKALEKEIKINLCKIQASVIFHQGCQLVQIYKYLFIQIKINNSLNTSYFK